MVGRLMEIQREERGVWTDTTHPQTERDKKVAAGPETTLDSTTHTRARVRHALSAAFLPSVPLNNNNGVWSL